MKLLVIDNYDSFTYNLVHFLGELGADSAVFRNDKITLEDLPTEVRQEVGPAAEGMFKLPAEGINFEDVERNLITQAMEQTDYNITKAAKLLGLTFRTLQYRLEKFGIRKPDGGEPSDGE